MLREFLASWLTPAGRYARRFGYVREGVGIESRHRRCRAAWEPHLQASRAAILAEAEEVRGGVAVVLGSGALLDVPLAVLAGHFDGVYLIDLFHPWSARLQARRFANIHLIEHDLLGIDRDGDPKPAPSRLRSWRDRLPPADFVVSLNLLTQLPLRPLERWGEALGLGWMTEVMAAHLADLSAGPGRACLISEFRHRSFDRQGREIERDEVLADFDLPQPFQTWVWPLAPLGELSRSEALEMDVAAYRLLPPSPFPESK